MQVSDSCEQLFEDVPGSFFLEDLGLACEGKQLSVLGYFHNVIHDSIYFPVNGSIYSADIEVNNLNYVPMFCFEADFDLVEKHVESLLLVSPLHVVLLYLVVHYLNRHPLVVLQSQSHLHSSYY